MANGRPRKKPRNISGLRNQQPNRPNPLSGPSVADIELDGTTPHSTASGSPSHPGGEDTDLPNTHDLANGEVGPEIDQDSESEREQQDFFGGLDDEKFGDNLFKTVVEDDPKDADFFPKRRRGEKILRGT
jgi:hypothetical protein